MSFDNLFAKTANGALTHATTGSEVLDFFSVAGALRKNQADFINLFFRAFEANRELALRALLWARDVRGGAGERANFRAVFNQLPEADRLALVAKVPEVGRWDDLFEQVDLPEVADFILFSLLEGRNGLLAKWLPRQGPVAKRLRGVLGLTAKEWRKTVVELSNTVEQKMSAKDWTGINYEHVPSRAATLYRKAFSRQDADRYQNYLTAVEEGKAKINASATYPHDLVSAVMSGKDIKTAELQWKALPNYLLGSEAKLLPVVDVSGSMDSANVLQHAVALGIYLAERNESVFKDTIISFSGTPNLHNLAGCHSLAEKVRQVRMSGEDMSTNLLGVFKTLLASARKLKVAQDDMPTHLVVLSDMEFNDVYSEQEGRSVYWHSQRMSRTNFEAIKAEYEKAGYAMPTLVFWNLFGRSGNSPVTMHETGTMLVSGFSPAIMKNVLKLETVTPYELMLDTLMSPRYSF